MLRLYGLLWWFTSITGTISEKMVRPSRCRLTHEMEESPDVGCPDAYTWSDQLHTPCRISCIHLVGPACTWPDLLYTSGRTCCILLVVPVTYALLYARSDYLRNSVQITVYHQTPVCTCTQLYCAPTTLTLYSVERGIYGNSLVSPSPLGPFWRRWSDPADVG